MNSLIWPVSREQALEILDFFCEYCLLSFGRFQDAMTCETQHGWSLYHSRLSFALNVKMLSPLEVITKALKLAFLGLVNRILGALFGAIKGAVLISFLIFLFGNFVIKYNNVIPKEYINNSILYEPLFEFGEKIYSICTVISSNYSSKDILESI